MPSPGGKVDFSSPTSGAMKKTDEERRYLKYRKKPVPA
jgi:hypothetical protein